ncbi:STAS domain-containing protein [Streptomyces sp. NPDC057939]|uniref:STAS domain-containing protein n=1 Tax=Streptomyces sp. NPDC057939 TaxID=3346284 RepID=UPI0036E7B591
MVPTLGINVRTHEAGTVITIAGELDCDTVPHIRRAINALDLRGHTLTLDFTDVTFMDSTALNMLLTTRLRAREQGGTLELLGLRPPALHVLYITGTAGLFNITDHPKNTRTPAH